MIFSVIIHEQNQEPIQWCFDNVVLQHDFAVQMMKNMYKTLDLEWDASDTTPVNDQEKLQEFLSKKEGRLNFKLRFQKKNPVTFKVYRSKLYTRDNYLTVQSDFLGEKE